MGMATSITKTNGDLLAVLGLGAMDDQASPLTLIGEGAEDWIEAMNQNWVHSVENFANDLPPSHPLQGQFWFDQRDRSLNLWSGSEWIEVVPGSGVQTPDGFEFGDTGEPAIPEDIAAAIEEARQRAEALIAEAEETLADRLALAETKLADAERFYIDSDVRLSQAVEGLHEIIGEYDPLYGTLGARVIQIADAQGDQATQIDAIQVVLGDEDHGLRGEVATLSTTFATNSEVTAQRLDIVEAALENGLNGDVQAAISNLANTTATADQALTTQINQARADFTANAATTNARITSAQQTAASATLAVAQDLDVVEAALNTPTTGLLAQSLAHTNAIADLNTNKATVDSVNALTAEARAKNKTYAQATNPTNVPAGTLVVGDVLYRTDQNNKMFRWNGTVWIAVVDARPPTYVQGTAPTGAITGALWINTANNNVVSQFNGTAWVAYEDPRVPAATAKILAHDQVIADLPNNYAAASQFTLIKTEVEGARNGSANLGAQLQSMRTATSDGLNLKASASDLNLLKTEVDTARNGSPNLSAQLLAMRNATSDGLALKATATEVNTLRTEVTDARNGSPTLTAQLQSMRTATSDGLALKATAIDFNALKAEVTAARNGKLNLLAEISSVRQVISDGLGLKIDASEYNILKAEITNARNGSPSVSAQLTDMRNATVNGDSANAGRIGTLEVRATVLPNLIDDGDFKQDFGVNWFLEGGAGPSLLYDGQVGNYLRSPGQYLVSKTYPAGDGFQLSVSWSGTATAAGANVYVQAIPSYALMARAYRNTANNWGQRYVSDGTTTPAPAGTTGYRVVVDPAGSAMDMSRIKVNYGTTATNWSDERTDVTTNARIKTVEQVTTNGTFSSATRTSELEASSDNQYLTRNSTFTLYDNAAQSGFTTPNYWGAWGEKTNDSHRIAGRAGNKYGWWSHNNSGPIGGGDVGISQDFNGNPFLNGLSAGYYVIEADIWFGAGQIGGAGIFFYFENGGDARINFATDPTVDGDIVGFAGASSRAYSWRKLVKIDNAGSGRAVFHLMTEWDGFEAGSRPKIIEWQRAGVRRATAQEVAAEKAFTNAGTALTRTTELVERGGGGGNLVGNATLQSTAGWSLLGRSGADEYLDRSLSGVNQPDINWRPAGENCLASFVTTSGSSDWFADWYSDPFALEPGKTYEFGAQAGQHRTYTTVYIEATHFNGSGAGVTYIQATRPDGAQYADQSNAGGTNLNNYTQFWGKFVCPANLTRGRLIMRRHRTDPGQSDSWSWFTRPFTREIPSGQTKPSPWDAGSQAWNLRAVWKQETAIAGASTFIRAESTNTEGRPTSSVAMGAQQFAVFNPGDGGWKKALEVVGGNVVLTGGLQAGAFIRLGNGNGWPVALRSVDFSAADGEVVNFGTDLGSLPSLAFGLNNLAPLNAGETYDIRAVNLTATGFTMNAKISVPATPSSQSSPAPGYSEVVNGYGVNGRTIYLEGKPSSTDGVYTISASGYQEHRVFRQFPGDIEQYPDDPGDTNSATTTIAVWAYNGVWNLVTHVYADSWAPLNSNGVVNRPWSFTETIQMPSNVSHINISHYDSTNGRTGGVNSLGPVNWQAQGSGSSQRSATPNGQKTKVTVRPQ